MVGWVSRETVRLDTRKRRRERAAKKLSSHALIFDGYSLKLKASYTERKFVQESQDGARFEDRNTKIKPSLRFRVGFSSQLTDQRATKRVSRRS